MNRQVPIYFEMGMDSIQSVNFQNEIENKLHLELPSTAVFDYPDIERMAKYLQSQQPISETDTENESIASMSLDQVVAELKNSINPSG